MIVLHFQVSYFNIQYIYSKFINFMTKQIKPSTLHLLVRTAKWEQLITGNGRTFEVVLTTLPRQR